MTISSEGPNAGTYDPDPFPTPGYPGGAPGSGYSGTNYSAPRPDDVVAEYPSTAFEPPSADGNSEDKSTAQTAKDEAAGVASHAADSAKDVAGVAKDQVAQVTAEAGKQVRQLVEQAQTELGAQAGEQQKRLAQGLKSVGEQLQAMAEGSEQPCVATDLTRQAAGRAHEIAEWFESREPGDVMREVKTFARRRPGAFLAIALGAGIVTGRLARGIQAGDPSSEDADSSPASADGQLKAANHAQLRSAEFDEPASPAGDLGSRSSYGTTFEPEVPPAVTGPLGGQAGIPGFAVPPTAGSAPEYGR